MSPQLAWYVARSAGVVAFLLVAAAVIWGMLLSTRLTTSPAPKWLLDLHRFLGTLALVFTGIHVAALVADSYVHFDVVDLLVPFASEWQPGAVALGVVGLWLLLAVQTTSMLMRRLPRSTWRAIHLSSYALFWVSALHGLAAGTDAGHPLYRIASGAAAAAVVFLTVVRVLSPKPARRATTGRPVATG